MQGVDDVLEELASRMIRMGRSATLAATNAVLRDASEAFDRVAMKIEAKPVETEGGKLYAEGVVVGLRHAALCLRGVADDLTRGTEEEEAHGAPAG